MFDAFALEDLLKGMTTDVADAMRPMIVTSASTADVLKKTIERGDAAP